MTAKEKLAERVMKLSEAEAEETLALLDGREGRLAGAFDHTGAEDEPWTEEDEAASGGGHADIAAARLASREESLRKHG